jgi:hypothetical protein
MPAPPAYLDECVDHDLVAALRARNFRITSALEQGRANSGELDDVQLAFATAQDWVLISHNETDFRRLARDYRRLGRPHGGIIILPESPPFERLAVRVAMLLDWLGAMPDRRSRYFKWGHLQSLLEQGHLLPGYTEDEIRLALAR